jgi:hypothetical protein
VSEYTYSPPVIINDDIVTFWKTMDTTLVTDQNCPEQKEFTSEGLGAVIEAHVNLDLSTLKETETGEYQCSPTQ